MTALLEYIVTALLEYIDILKRAYVPPAHPSLKDESFYAFKLLCCTAVLLLFATHCWQTK